MEEFNKLAAESFTVRLAQANLLKENNLANFVKKTDFNYKLKDLNKNESNDLTEKVKAISMIGLTKDLINKFSILNGSKHFLQEHFKII